MKQSIEDIRHSLAHIMASAVGKLYPGVKFGIGPMIEDGFYYDFDLSAKASGKGGHNFSSDDLPKIEKKMKEIIAENIKFEKKEISIKEAQKTFKDQPFKLELLNELSQESSKVSIYQSGNFIDLCKGPHVNSSKDLNPDAFKLSRVAGAYWRGEEKNPQLQRIYGTAFETKKDLEEYLELQKEAEKRDHRKLGKKLELFTLQAGAPGFVFWLPKGMLLREALMNFYNNLLKEANYQTVSTPILLAEELWHKSGHWDNYKDQMYFTKIDDKTFVIKPMNCPGVMLIYKSKPRSYRELPLRFAEAGEVHRHEPSGTLHGLFRVRAFRQDDAHIFVRENQIKDELKDLIELILKFYEIFNFAGVEIELSTRPEKSIGSDEIWEKSETILKKVLQDLNLEFRISEGEGAFYGPKIDFHIKDSLSRSWQCATVQVDFSMPERFELKYVDKDGSLKSPIVIHRTIIGSVQRFVGILIEHYAGAFPAWLSPIQVAILPINDNKENIKYCLSIIRELRKQDIRVWLDDRNETISKKIREAELQKIPYLLIIGDKEVESKKVSIRERQKGDIGGMPLEKFLEKITKEIKGKT